MTTTQLLSELDVLVIDCQASGATPVHGDLLELAWARVAPEGELALRAHWLVPRTQRRISRAVRELTGWSEARLAEAVDEREAWQALEADLQTLTMLTDSGQVPTVIHFARFELPFLRDLHTRLGSGELPLDVQCLHAIAARLHPTLPRKNIRALAGFLGHSAPLLRSAAGHVDASAFIWRALVQQLAERGVYSWPQLADWLREKAPVTRSARRSYPLSVERRRALPDRPGVYRFVRKNGDVLYVGKATSIKKRIAGHFRSTGPNTERALELLTQVHEIVISETASTLEAALLECDEIKALDPPYNVQLRAHERCAWFATPDLRDAQPASDALHTMGPLPSRRAVSALPAMAELLAGNEPTPLLMAQCLAVPLSEIPETGLFAEGFSGFVAQLAAGDAKPARKLAEAGSRLWLERRRNEAEPNSDEAAPAQWDLARVRRRLDRNLIQASLLTRRARWLCLLADADVAFCEQGQTVRLLVWSGAQLVERQQLSVLSELDQRPVRTIGPLSSRRACFDAVRYDRLRVLATELARVQAEGGELRIRCGSHLLSGQRLTQLLRWL